VDERQLRPDCRLYPTSQELEDLRAQVQADAEALEVAQEEKWALTATVQVCLVLNRDTPVASRAAVGT
jgi:hypothetical protein